MKRRAVFPGSFDPITIGHFNIVERAKQLFDQIVIAIGINESKKYYHPLEERVNYLKALYKNDPQIEINAYSGLTVDFCKTEDANFIVRGLRSTTDFEYEKNIALFNRQLNPSIETIFLMSAPEYSHISSSIVREILKHGGDAERFIPKPLNSKELG